MQCNLLPSPALELGTVHNTTKGDLPGPILLYVHIIPPSVGENPKSFSVGGVGVLSREGEMNLLVTSGEGRGRGGGEGGGGRQDLDYGSLPYTDASRVQYKVCSPISSTLLVLGLCCRNSQQRVFLSATF